MAEVQSLNAAWPRGDFHARRTGDESQRGAHRWPRWPKGEYLGARVPWSDLTRAAKSSGWRCIDDPRAGRAQLRLGHVPGTVTVQPDADMRWLEVGYEVGALPTSGRRPCAVLAMGQSKLALARLAAVDNRLVLHAELPSQCDAAGLAAGLRLIAGDIRMSLRLHAAWAEARPGQVLRKLTRRPRRSGKAARALARQAVCAYARHAEQFGWTAVAPTPIGRPVLLVRQPVHRAHLPPTCDLTEDAATLAVTADIPLAGARLAEDEGTSVEALCRHLLLWSASSRVRCQLVAANSCGSGAPAVALARALPLVGLEPDYIADAVHAVAEAYRRLFREAQALCDDETAALYLWCTAHGHSDGEKLQ